MHTDPLIQTLSKMPYPFINRHDRTLYQHHPHADPLRTFKHSLIAGLTGYWVGKVRGRREGLLALIFPLPVVSKFIWDEWRISRLEGVAKFG